MRKIIVGAQVSLDGVMQSPGGPTEDPTKGFKFGGWSMPYFDQAGGEEIMSLFKDKFDLLLGRKTYEIFAAYWPYYEEDAPHGSVAKAFSCPLVKLCAKPESLTRNGAQKKNISQTANSAVDTSPKNAESSARLRWTGFSSTYRTSASPTSQSASSR